MNKSRFIRGLALFGVLAMLLTLVVGVGAQDKKVLHTGVLFGGGDVETIDPNLGQVNTSIQIIETGYVGLTTQVKTTGDLAPGIATDWSVSDDGKTWTFNMIHDIPWVKYNPDTDAVEQVMDDAGNPRYVTAQDVVNSWKRVLDPATASPYAYVPVEYVVGGADFNGGTGSADDLAIKAVDDYTFQVTQPEAVGFAPIIYGLWMVNPIPQWAIDECGDSWTEPDCYETYGPFALKDWSHDESLTVVKNPFWPGTDSVPQAKLDEVVFHFLDPQTQFNEYQAGTLDAISPPIEELDRIKSDPTLSQELYIGTDPATYYVGINLELPVVGDSVHLRRALSYAVDRQSIVDNVTKGGQIPARWFARPGLNAAPTLETNPDLGIGYDPDMAKQELALALQDLGVASAADIPTITLGVNDSAGHRAIMEAIQGMWRDTLGITVEITAMDSSTYFTVLEDNAPQLYRLGWGQDYPDADNFDRGVFRSDSSQNHGHFNSPEFDQLVDQARLETDTDARRALYVQAEDILVNQVAAIIPIYWYSRVEVTKPDVERTYSITGTEAYQDWDLNR